MTDSTGGRAVGPIDTERDFWRAVVGLIYRTSQFADFGPYENQRPAVLEDVHRLWAYLDGLDEAIVPMEQSE